MEILQELYKSLSLRKRPEDVAQLVAQALSSDLNNSEVSLLEKVAKGSLIRMFFSYTSMSQEFSRAVGAGKQINKAIEIFKTGSTEGLDPNYIPDVQHFVKEISPIIHKGFGQNNFLADRLNKVERRQTGLDLSKRAYNKKWRVLKRLELKIQRVERETQKAEFQMIGKHGLAHRLDFEQFSKDVSTACFIAYYNSRCNLRSVFTNQRQTRAFDEVSDMLFKRCLGKRVQPKISLRSRKIKSQINDTNWLAISFIYPGKDVLVRLTSKQKGELLGKWTHVLEQIAMFLNELWLNNDIDREYMIVKRGNDSTTWNHAAGAWNTARDHWMNLIYALGLEYILEDLCFGKVMRLMAADVVEWHYSSGGAIDPNTRVWRKLPLPWEVFNGTRQCNKQLVIECCRLAGLNAEKSGWIAPRAHRIEKFEPTPELVHGVQISNPFLATLLRKRKVFSGKQPMS